MSSKESELELIRQERQRILAEMKDVQEDLADVERQLEENRPDFGLGRGSPQLYEWEMNLARRDRLQGRVEKLQVALDRIQEGKYGICVRCGQPISAERLAVLPATQLCAKCARELAEQRKKRRGPHRHR